MNDALNPLLERVRAERAPHLSDPEARAAYLAQHSGGRHTPFAGEDDVQFASRVRGLMRTDLLHEPTCSGARDRICRLVAEKNALLAVCKTLWPANLAHVPDHLADDFTFPVDVTAGELRALAAAISKATGEAR